MSKTRANRIWMLMAAAVVWSAGCGLEVEESTFEDQEVVGEEPNGEEPGSDELGAGSGAGTMSGTWMQIHVASNCVFGQEQVSSAIYVVDIETQGKALQEERKLCSLQMSPVLGFEPIVSQEILDSIVTPVIDTGMTTKLVEGGTYVSSTEIGLWGLDLDDPLRDSLPTDPDDPRVIDGDGDGNPGVSMDLDGSGCARYMSQRQIVTYFGTFEAPNDIRGGSATSTENEVYGASGAVCELAPPIEANDAHSFFRMVRIDGLGGSVDARNSDGEIGCPQVEPFAADIWEVRAPDNDLCD